MEKKKSRPTYLECILVDLKAVAWESPERASRFFKTAKGTYGEGDVFMGVAVPAVRAVAKHYQHLSFDHLATVLKSPINEVRLLALLVLARQFKKGNDDVKEGICDFFLKNMERINNWNLVDLAAPHILGEYLVDKDRRVLEELALSPVLWERRIGIVATWAFIKRGDVATTYRIAQMLLQDREDLIHKATGWMLREAGKKDEDKLLGFLKKHGTKMPRTMWRYATERLTPAQMSQLPASKKSSSKKSN